MRVLLDENIRATFATHLTGHTVDHLDALGMKGITNGELLVWARERYDVLVTLARGILHQQRH